MQGQAQDLGGNWLAANDLNFSERYLAAVKTRHPGRSPTRRAPISHAGKPHALRPAARRAPRQKPSPMSKLRSDHPIQKFELPNGLRLLVKEDHRLPFVEFRAVFKGGVLAETPENNGVTQLTGKMLLKGTQTPLRRADRAAKSNPSAAASTATAATTVSA